MKIKEITTKDLIDFFSKFPEDTKVHLDKNGWNFEAWETAREVIDWDLIAGECENTETGEKSITLRN